MILKSMKLFLDIFLKANLFWFVMGITMFIVFEILFNKFHPCNVIIYTCTTAFILQFFLAAWLAIKSNNILMACMSILYLSTAATIVIFKDYLCILI